MSRAETLLFCIGATKAGTSWLHRYISDHPEAHMRAIKEVHYFDTLEFANRDYYIAEAVQRRDAAKTKAAAATGPAIERISRIAADAEDWRQLLDTRERDDVAYLGYLEAGRTAERLVGDMTPAYAMLPSEWLVEMAALAPNVRFLYILRDPVERLWSHCRMIAQRRAADPSEIRGRSVNILRRVQMGKEPEILRRSDYIGPLTRMQAVLPPESWRVFFYEELFQEDTIRALCSFLGLSYAPADFAKEVMVGPTAVMEPGQFDEARAFLDDQYSYLAAELPRLPAAWAAREALN